MSRVFVVLGIHVAIQFRFLLEILLRKISFFHILLRGTFINTLIVRIILRFIVVLLLYNIYLYSMAIRRRSRIIKKFPLITRYFIYIIDVYVLHH